MGGASPFPRKGKTSPDRGDIPFPERKDPIALGGGTTPSPGSGKRKGPRAGGVKGRLYRNFLLSATAIVSQRLLYSLSAWPLCVPQKLTLLGEP